MYRFDVNLIQMFYPCLLCNCMNENKCMYSADDYATARQFLSIAEEQSDIQMATQIQRKRKRRQNPKYKSSRSYSDEIEKEI